MRCLSKWHRLPLCLCANVSNLALLSKHTHTHTHTHTHPRQATQLKSHARTYTHTHTHIHPYTHPRQAAEPKPLKSMCVFPWSWPTSRLPSISPWHCVQEEGGWAVCGIPAIRGKTHPNHSGVTSQVSEVIARSACTG